jgi:tetratricopeptide (TPR) repeat protein
MKERHPRPVLPDDITGAELDRSVRQELSSLHSAVAKAVSRHLVMAGRLLDDDPETAYLHAAAAREQAARVASVREAVGLAAYRSGRFAEALTELRTARRLTGSNVHLPVMADCERGMGRPDRALALTQSDEARELDVAGRVELMIVAAGARADLGEPEAAVVVLQLPQLQSTAHEPWVARLRSAYSDTLSAVGRHADARHWLELAAEADEDGQTGAAERLAELDGLVLIDLQEDEDQDDIEGEDQDDVGDPSEREAR